MMTKAALGGVLVAISCVAACSTGAVDDGGTSDSAIAIDPATESPAKILPAGYVTTLQALVPQSDVGKSFGLDNDHIPYPDTYWPFKYTDDSSDVTTKNGIDARWQGAEIISPLEKYMDLLDPGHTAAAKSWEANHHGENVPGVASWFGHCPGWTGASMVNAPLKHGLSVKSTGGKLVKCGGDEEGCSTFEVGDINALEAEVFVDGESTFLGARCDTAPDEIARDKDGRVLKSGCRGLNPGAVMVILANRMKNVKAAANFVPQAIAIDAQNEANTDQIWNQPAYRYTLNDAGPMTEAEAIKATASPDNTNRPAKYPYNPAAKGWYRVDVDILWVSENGPNRGPVSGADSTQTMHFAAILELDGDPANAASNVIGGEFLDDDAAGVNRLTVPPFMWTTTGPGPEDSTRHNPYVKSSRVQQLVKLALEE